MGFEYTLDREYPSVVRFFSNATNGIDMNVACSFGGTPHKIHNGTDSTEWTATVESGSSNRFDFDSTDQANSGTKSIDATNSNNGNVALFSKPSGTIDPSSYVAITGYIYIESWSTSGTAKRVDIQLRNNGTNLGNSVDLGAYVANQVFDVWQKFCIPFEHLGITTELFDEMTLTTIDEGVGSAPNYYVDDIQIEETGTPIVFSLTPPENKLYTVWAIKFSFVAPWTAMTSDGSKPKIVYNKFMDLSALTNGLLIQDHRVEGIRFSSTVKQNSELFSLPVAEWRVIGYDETDAVVEVLFNFEGHTPVILDDAAGDYNSITILDDLSSLKHFRASARGTIIDTI